MPPRSSARSGRSRLVLVMAVVAVLVVIAAVIAVVIAVNGGGDTSAQGSDSTGASTSASQSSTTPHSSSASATAIGTWSDYSNFTQLVGDSPGSTSSAYKGATCALAGPAANTPGMIDQIECTKLTGTPVTFFVGRFSGKSATDAYVASLVKQNYKKIYWTIAAERRGLLLTSPVSQKSADVTSSICAFPQFLVEFYAEDTAGLTSASVEKNFWENATFPNTTPGVCS